MGNTRGAAAENLVANHLVKRGHTIIQRNFHSRFGEIDILSEWRGQLIVTEVKARSSCLFGTPAESVTKNKQQKIIRCLKHFLNTHPFWHTAPIRFDVASVITDQRGAQIDIIEAAFEAN
jgi:putative endonuclease